MKLILKYIEYPRDNSLNPFGDYNLLVMAGIRTETGDTKKWFLVGLSKGFVQRSLSDEDVVVALEQVFHSQAKFIDIL